MRSFNFSSSFSASGDELRKFWIEIDGVSMKISKRSKIGPERRF